MWHVGVVKAQQAALFKKWSIYTSDFFGAQKMNSKLPQVIFYREADFIEREVADIYIDGKYYMFLLANSYKPVQLCAQTHLFGVALSNSEK